MTYTYITCASSSNIKDDNGSPKINWIHVICYTNSREKATSWPSKHPIDNLYIYEQLQRIGIYVRDLYNSFWLTVPLEINQVL